MPERVSPELQYLEVKFAALMSYGLTVNVLQEELPLDHVLGGSSEAAVNANRADRTGLGDLGRANARLHLPLLPRVGGLFRFQPASQRGDLAPDWKWRNTAM
ncbi:hypothetical protein CTP10_R69780 (plasmid) [Cupriavidus sp. P-10]|uniref:hypothetical protein n=1 Tax=Cupriavidus sp. P-10 TaxID=2027911 RepID=UPI00218C072C|nr:hypothetical protein CTP10_R69780 [Cupriavidus sp. P-10]